MRAKEFMKEDTSNLSPDVAKAIPGVYVFPELTNQDPYKQYRFGLEIAAAARDHSVADATKWGENLVVATYSDGEEDILDRAAKKAGVSKKQITSTDSSETNDVNKTSPVAAPKRNKYGV